jgi:hypothetical protein
VYGRRDKRITRTRVAVDVAGGPPPTGPCPPAPAIRPGWAGDREMGRRMMTHERAGGEAGAVHLAPVSSSRDTAGGPTGVGRPALTDRVC